MQVQEQVENRKACSLTQQRMQEWLRSLNQNYIQCDECLYYTQRMTAKFLNFSLHFQGIFCIIREGKGPALVSCDQTTGFRYHILQEQETVRKLKECGLVKETKNIWSRRQSSDRNGMAGASWQSKG